MTFEEMNKTDEERMEEHNQWVRAFFARKRAKEEEEEQDG